jgi:Heterokaryon incompatibility protein (HET)
LSGISGQKDKLEYNKLKSSSEIQIVKLEPDDVDDPIGLQLFTTDLLELVEYQALSCTCDVLYVGFPPERDNSESKLPIAIHGRGFGVRRNVHNALLHFLQGFGGPESFWIDAICINRQDDKDRGTEVLQLKVIYQKCSETIAWFGHDMRHSRKLMLLLRPGRSRVRIVR